MAKAKEKDPKDEKDPKAAFPGAAPPFAAKSDDDPELAKAGWTTADINTFPDASFLHVEGGGEKDDEGKTKPRTLRHFPVRDADGKADLPHLRNALARIPQSDLPQDVKDKCTAAAQKMLDDATAEEKPPAESEKTEKASVAAPAAAADAAAPEAPPAVPAEPVAKAGKVLALHRMEKLRAAHKAFADAHKALGDLISEMEPEAEPEGPSAGVAAAKAETAASAPPAPSEVAPVQAQSALVSTVEALAKSVAGIASLVARQQADIATIRKAVPASSAIPAEGTPRIAKREGGWSRDMARQDVESELSFR